MSDVAIEFRTTTRERVVAAANALMMIPALSERALTQMDLAYAAGARVLAVGLRLDDQRFSRRARQRLTFWCARAGGSVRTSPPPSHRVWDLVLPHIAPADLASAVDQMCTRVGEPLVLAPPLAPLLTLDAGGPAAAGIAYDACSRRLFVPSPVVPPVGDSFVLEVVLPPPATRRVRGFVRVEDARPRGASAPGRPPGFTIALGSEAADVHAALLATVVPADLRSTRASPRLRAVAPVSIVSGEDAGGASGTRAVGSLRDISLCGAFIRTSTPPPVGSRVRLSMPLPDGSDFEAIAIVRRVADDGAGVEFRLDSYGESRLARALTAVAGRSHRVLIVDDDALARRMLADAFKLQGFEVLTAEDAELGLSILADEILTLDALVTDLHMPGVDGEAFVRRIRGPGGEVDLPIIVVTATLDPAAKARVHAAGASRVVLKSGGPDLIVRLTVGAVTASRTKHAPAENVVASG